MGIYISSEVFRETLGTGHSEGTGLYEGDRSL